MPDKSQIAHPALRGAVGINMARVCSTYLCPFKAAEPGPGSFTQGRLCIQRALHPYLGCMVMSVFNALPLNFLTLSVLFGAFLLRNEAAHSSLVGMNKKNKM